MPAPHPSDRLELLRARLRDAELRVERSQQAVRKLRLSGAGWHLMAIAVACLVVGGVYGTLTLLKVSHTSSLAWCAPVAGWLSFMGNRQMARRLKKARTLHQRRVQQEQRLRERLQSELAEEAHPANSGIDGTVDQPHSRTADPTVLQRHR